MKQFQLTLLFLSISIINLFATITFDGTITESDWGTALATSSGGPANSTGFGAGHEINAIYADGDATNIYLGIAGNVQNGNRILLFIDSKTGGYSNGNFGRTSAPAGINGFNSGTTFDAGFEPDYCLLIGTNGSGTYFFDLYTLSGSVGSGGGPNTFLGNAGSSGLGANPLNSSETRGFEATISKTALGYTSGDVKVMGMYISDGTSFLNNKFLTVAGSGQGSYGSGSVSFGSEPPNPVTIPASLLPVSFVNIEAKFNWLSTTIKWSTGSELDNSHFNIQRSSDSRTWNTIGKVAGNGTTLGEQHYTFTDESPFQGLNYYRLQQVDFNGNHEYSKVVSATFGESNTVRILPNPASHELHLQGTGDTFTALIFDQNGSLKKEASTNFIVIEDLIPGVYFIKILDEAGQSLHVERFVKQ